MSKTISNQDNKQIREENIADKLHYIVDLASRMKIINQSSGTVIERVGQIIPFWIELNQGTDAFYTTKGRRIVKSISKGNDKYDLILCNSDFLETELRDYCLNEYFILIDDIPTNYVIRRNDGLYFTYLDINNKEGFLGEIANIFRFPIADYENPEFARYTDFEPDSESNVIMAYKTKEGWFGGSHRATHHFKVGETISVSSDSLLLSHDCTPNCRRYEEEIQHINEIKQLVKDDEIEVKDFETAKKLAIRLCEATG